MTLKDNYGKPRQEYIDKITLLNDEKYLVEAESKIWLSAYAMNNPRSDYHWQVTALYDEAQRRGKSELYMKAYKEASSI